MKKIIFLLSLIISSTLVNAQDDYKNLWIKVQQFEVDNLPKSALKIVNEIYTKAANENNSPQLIKTLFYQSKFSLTLEEDAQLKVINQFKEQIAKHDYPTKNVLENVLATLYWQYFNQNRYRFYNRTKTDNKVNNEDFRTWDLQTLFKEIHQHYKASLANGLLLQQSNIYDFKDILNLHKDSKIYRPTLFDLLANNALAFYKTSETNITQPTYQFTVDNPDFLSDFKTFSTLSTITKDNLSLQFNALEIYKDLIRFHSKDKDPRALVNIDLERIDFVKQHATFNAIDSFYLETLKNSKKQFQNNPVSGLYAFKIASFYRDQANAYHPNTNEKNRFKNKEAIAICNAIITKFPNSIAQKKCTQLKEEILSKSITIIAEKFIPIGKPSRALINYKNLDSLYFTSFKITNSDLKKWSKIYNNDKKIAFIKSLKKTQTWQTILRNENDYLAHSTEVIIPTHTSGHFLILASENKSLTQAKIYGTAFIQITDLTLIENNFNKKYNYQVVHRNSGQPIENATIQLKNYIKNDRYNSPIDKTLLTDKNGFASYQSKKRHNNVEIKVNYKNDKATFGSRYFYKNNSVNHNPTNLETSIKPFFFTDRSIYRPGQTIYFKTILIKKTGEKSEPFTNNYIQVALKDANGQKVSTLNIKLNDFGSASGEFIIPNNGLTGTYSFSVGKSDKESSTYYDKANFNFAYTHHTISVEEYKRPKFSTEFKPTTDSYKVNDSITITGFAKAFSGANITEGKVVYRVHRTVNYPNWYYWRRPNYSSENQEITKGETITDAKGAFKIVFKAIPNKSVSKEDLPVFKYQISADVTDINGETRSATTTVKVGYHSLLATLAIPSKIDKNTDKNTIAISTVNLNDEFVPAKGKVQIYKLKAPKNPLRKRVWSAPFYQDIKENDFRKLFPNSPYTDAENEEKKWQKGALVFSTKFNTKNSKEVQLKSLKKWVSGKYIAVLESADKFGKAVKDEQKFELFTASEKTVSDAKLFSINTNKSSYEPNENVELQIGSASKDITVTIQVEKNHRITDTFLIHLNNEKKQLKIPVKQEDIGGFAIKYHFVNYNYFKSSSLLISVPKKQESIHIETNLFRDKLQPGQNETWSFTIKNDKKNKVAAEVLAAMYDASLDQFKPHNWQFNPISYKSYYSYNTSRANQSFGTEYFRMKNNWQTTTHVPNQQYDAINWFGFSLNNNRWLNRQYLRSVKKTLANTISSRTSFDKIITGVVSDTSGPLPGANIKIKGTNFGAITNFDGEYSIKVKNGDVLVYSFIGMLSVEEKVSEKSTISITMEGNEAALEEVVIVGYAEEEKVYDVNMSLNGKAAGIAVRQVNGSANAAIKIRGKSSLSATNKPIYIVDGKIVDTFNISENEILSTNILKGKEAISLYGDKAKNGVIIITTKTGQAKLAKELSKVKIRKNLQETAFFFPLLKTDKKGNISFNFTAPEALTQWKLQLLAHTKELSSATKTLTTVTQKELMVVPNAPRFLREGDTIIFSSKISNLSDKNLNGFAKLELTDAISGKEINTDLGNINSMQNFSVDTKGNTTVSWNLQIPETIKAVQYKVIAKAGDFSDGEQNALPVLSNRMLVTETLPMWVRSNQTKTFTLDKLKNNGSSTLKNHKLTLEITSNPAWYAVQSLPYLMEYPYECAEQTFSRYYANTLASFIANSNPRIQDVFKQWKSSDALLSNLEKNAALKSMIIQETPWVRDAQSETAQKKRIALLFDIHKMSNEQQKAIQKLADMQMSSGGFPWFKGGRYPSTFITQHIASGYGHLKKLGVSKFKKSTEKMIHKAVQFLDDELLTQYQDLLKRARRIKEESGQEAYENYLSKNQLNYFVIQYLYMRSFYNAISLPKKTQTAVNYYKNQTATYWNTYNLYAKGQIALIHFRTGEKSIASKILASLKENSITSDELGMYWKENTAGYYYYQAPIETQALLIEVFSEIENDTKTVDNLRIWLLKNKQTNRWKTTKATTEAVYALLLNGSDWISITEMVDVTVGDKKINPNTLDDVKVEAGTGYFKTSWSTAEITPKMGEVSITKKGKGIAWGGLYWQYFEDLDKITSAATPLKLNKKIFLKTNGETGKELKEIHKDTALKIGDLLTVRIELRVDRNMEFIHMKDMRASGLEPINVLSKYKWQDGLGYYESTKDAATNFFFDRLQKGVYVFEYDVGANNAGNFSNGITTIQSMYAPEFSSHSEGVRISILKE